MSTVKRYTGNLNFEGLTANSVVSFNSNSSILINGDLEVLGNTTLSGNISGDSLNSGTTSIGIPTPGGNANITVGGVSNVLVIATTGAAVTGNLSVSGTLTAGAFAPSSLSVSGNISGTNVNAAGNVFVTQNARANTPTIRLTDSNTATPANTVIGSYEWFATDSSAPGARVVAAVRANTVDTAGNVRVDILTGNSAALTQSVSVLPNGNVGVANTVPGHLFSVNGAGYFGTTITAVGNVVGGNVTTAGQVSATANVTGGNLRTGGQISATGNILGDNLAMSGAATAASFSATGNVTGGNINTAGQVLATGNVTGGNIVTGGAASVSGAITGGSLQVSGTANAASLTGGVVSVTGAITGGSTLSVTGNATVGNVGTAGRVSATGNIVSAGFFIGDGSQLINVTAASNVTVTTLANGTTSMQVLGSGGNIVANVGGTTSVALFTPTGVVVSALSATGNVTGGNIVTAGTISTTGNVQAANVNGTAGVFTTVTGNANATSLTSGTVPSARLTGSYAINITGTAATANTVTDAAQPNITSVGTLTSLAVTANVQAGNLRTSGEMLSTGNATVGNLITSGIITTTGNVVAGNVIAGVFSATGNTQAGNLITGGIVSATGNITTGNLISSGIVSATGNVTANTFIGSGAGLSSIPGGNVTGTVASATSATSATTAGTVTTNAQPNITSVGTLTSVSVTGNITGGNLLISGAILDSAQLDIQTTAANANIVLTPNGTGNVNIGRMSASGNITAAAYYGSGAGLSAIPGGNVTGTVASATSATTAGTVTTNAQPNITSVGTLTGLAVTTASSLISQPVTFTQTWNNANAIFTAVRVDINTTAASAASRFLDLRDDSSTVLFVGLNGTIDTIGNIVTTANVSGGNIVTANATIIGSSGTISALGNITGGNLIGTHVGNLTGTTVSVSGNITGGNLSVGNGTVSLNNIVNNGANATGNIGSSTNYFNRVFATATTALYADLAEYYRADREYVPGTVLVFGGNNEVTLCEVDNDARVAGVVTTEPAYVMNAGLSGEFTVAVALQGRVPVQVLGPVSKGDLMVTGINGHAQANNQARAGTILGKSLENFDGTTGTIEIAVGRS
jgi:filamentous hemagglutinin